MPRQGAYSPHLPAASSTVSTRIQQRANVHDSPLSRRTRRSNKLTIKVVVPCSASPPPGLPAGPCTLYASLALPLLTDSKLKETAGAPINGQRETLSTSAPSAVYTEGVSPWGQFYSPVLAADQSPDLTYQASVNQTSHCMQPPPPLTPPAASWEVNTMRIRLTHIILRTTATGRGTLLGGQKLGRTAATKPAPSVTALSRKQIQTSSSSCSAALHHESRAVQNTISGTCCPNPQGFQGQCWQRLFAQFSNLRLHWGSWPRLAGPGQACHGNSHNNAGTDRSHARHNERR